jgi:hypothetical protein
LLVRDHQGSFPIEERRWYPHVHKLGNSNCRQRSAGGEF